MRQRSVSHRLKLPQPVGHVFGVQTLLVLHLQQIKEFMLRSWRRTVTGCSRLQPRPATRTEPVVRLPYYR